MNPSPDDILPTLAADPVLGPLTFEVVEVAGFKGVVAREIAPASSVELWRTARARCPPDFWPLLTDSALVHSDFAPLPALAAEPLAAVRKARERVVRSSKEASAALRALARAAPQPEPYDERDSFLEDPESASLSLVLLCCSMVEAVRPFSPDAEGTTPRHAELVTMLAHFNQRYGAEPLYADGDRLELEVRRPPQAPDDLRALARDFFLLSQGNREGLDVEEPARLLRRLTSDRWVLWWYGT